MTLKRCSDFPYNSDSTSRFLSVVVAVMVFLVVLAMAGTLVTQNILECWYRDMSGILTVQVATVSGDSPIEIQQRIDAVMMLLQNTPGIAVARSLKQQQIAKLLEPWSASAERLADLPVPSLIDVVLCTGMHVNIKVLVQRLVEIMPGTLLDDHQAWLLKLVRLGWSLELLTLSIVAVTVTTTTSVIIHTTISRLDSYYSAIEILYLVGAHDDYIACQFAHVSLVQSLRGSILGLIMAVLVLVLISWLGSYWESNFLSTLSLYPLQIVGLGILPISVAWLSMVTVLITFKSTMARVP